MELWSLNEEMKTCECTSPQHNISQKEGGAIMRKMRYVHLSTESGTYGLGKSLVKVEK